MAELLAIAAQKLRGENQHSVFPGQPAGRFDLDLEEYEELLSSEKTVSIPGDEVA